MLIIIYVYFEIDKCNDVKRNIEVNLVTIASRCILRIPFTCNISHLLIAVMWPHIPFQETNKISVHVTNVPSVSLMFLPYTWISTESSTHS